MEHSLMTALIERDIVKKGTILTIKGRKKGDDKPRNFLMEVVQIEPINKNISGTGYNIMVEFNNDPMRKKMNLNVGSVVYIENMTPKKLAAAFDLKEDGSKKPMGKPRGRPRKHPLPQNSK